MRRTAKLMLVKDSFTVCVTSWRCSSVSSRAKSASLRAASVDAKFLPKSKIICEMEIRATVGSIGLSVDLVTKRVDPVGMADEAALFDVAAVKVPVTCGKSDDSAWSTRYAAAM